MEENVEGVIGSCLELGKLVIDPVAEHQQGSHARHPSAQRVHGKIRHAEGQVLIVKQKRAVERRPVHLERDNQRQHASEGVRPVCGARFFCDGGCRPSDRAAALPA